MYSSLACLYIFVLYLSLFFFCFIFLITFNVRRLSMAKYEQFICMSNA